MIKEHTFVLKIKTNNSELKECLGFKLNQLSKEINGSIVIFELNKKGAQKAEKLLR